MIVFVQRVFSDYRAPFFQACGEACGGVEVFHHRNQHFEKVKEPKQSPITSHRFGNWLPAFLERRGLFFNPRLAFAVAQRSAVLVVIEGESNLLNNLFIVPLLLLRGQPYACLTLGRPTTTNRTWRRRLLWPLAKFMLRRAHVIACYSSVGKEYLVEQGLPPERIAVLHNSLDPKTVLCNSPENQKASDQWLERQGWQDRLRLVYLGALAEDKRPMLLVEAAGAFQERTGQAIGLIFVGDGPELQRCQSRASALGVEAEFVGRQKPADAGAFVLAGHAVVLPGLGGLAINHAMMLGRPVICGRADGTELDLVVDGETGFYLDPLDEESLIRTFDHLAADLSAVEQLGRRAREHVNQTATLENMVQRLLADSRVDEERPAKAA